MEFNNGSGFAWITEGREIENYLDSEELKAIAKSVDKNYIAPSKNSKWNNYLSYKKTPSGPKTNVNKVKVAREYVNKVEPNYECLDLDENINKLVSFIKSSNDI